MTVKKLNPHISRAFSFKKTLREIRAKRDDLASNRSGPQGRVRAEERSDDAPTERRPSFRARQNTKAPLRGLFLLLPGLSSLASPQGCVQQNALAFWAEALQRRRVADLSCSIVLYGNLRTIVTDVIPPHSFS